MRREALAALPTEDGDEFDPNKGFDLTVARRALQLTGHHIPNPDHLNFDFLMNMFGSEFQNIMRKVCNKCQKTDKEIGKEMKRYSRCEKVY